MAAPEELLLFRKFSDGFMYFIELEKYDQKIPDLGILSRALDLCLSLSLQDTDALGLFYV